jgi:hypothetical protein
MSNLLSLAISSEYGTNILDSPRSLPTKIVVTERLPNNSNDDAAGNNGIRGNKDYVFDRLA